MPFFSFHTRHSLPSFIFCTFLDTFFSKASLLKRISEGFSCARCEDVWVSGGLAPLLCKLGSIWDEWCRLHVSRFMRYNSPRYPDSRRLSRPQNQCECFGNETNFLPLSEVQCLIPGYSSVRPVTMLATLFLF